MRRGATTEAVTGVAPSGMERHDSQHTATHGMAPPGLADAETRRALALEHDELAVQSRDRRCRLGKHEIGRLLDTADRSVSMVWSWVLARHQTVD